MWPGLAGLLSLIFWMGHADRVRAAPPEGHWRLIWNEEFDGTHLDGAKWRILTGPRRAGFWAADDVSLDGAGCLVLRTEKDGDRYTCGAVSTQGGKFDHAYG